MKVADLAVINFLNLSTYSSTKIFKGKVYKFEVELLKLSVGEGGGLDDI